ncbi:MAG: undecaprenyl/decaprenyl-phosphate alpha-N-acetylglucosaminyl 1-phosphate transferase [Acidobacteriota bacterium]|nr:MAG: undecaprenyl/decaprenyl-phosphate alpha-N-acetylglucosaminyl 1-phosphate transferase [Acidobacteriota bacterium]
MIRWRFIYLYFFLVSAGVSLFLVPLFRRFALRFQVMDHPGERKLHTEPLPLFGGGAIFCAIVAVVAFHYAVQPMMAQSGFVQTVVPEFYRSYLHGIWAFSGRMWTIFLGAAFISALGLLDDVRGVSIRMRFLFEILIAVAVVAIGIKPDIAVFPQPLVWLVSVIWIVGITNSMNLLDGADGLAAGVGAIAALLLAWVMALGGQPLPAVFLLVLAGAVAGFLRYNFPPARIFMGSWGSMLIGYLLAVAVLLTTDVAAGENWLLPILIPLLILGIPLYDTFSVIAIRLAQGRSPVLADQNHFVHRLMRFGFSPKQAVLFIYLLTLCIGINATLLLRADARTSFILLLQILMTFGVIVVLERVLLAHAAALRKKRKETKT